MYIATLLGGVYTAVRAPTAGRRAVGQHCCGINIGKRALAVGALRDTKSCRSGRVPRPRTIAFPRTLELLQVTVRACEPAALANRACPRPLETTPPLRGLFHCQLTSSEPPNAGPSSPRPRAAHDYCTLPASSHTATATRLLRQVGLNLTIPSPRRPCGPCACLQIPRRTFRAVNAQHTFPSLQIPPILPSQALCPAPGTQLTAPLQQPPSRRPHTPSSP